MEQNKITLEKKRKYFCDDNITLTSHAQRKLRKLAKKRFKEVRVSLFMNLNSVEHKKKYSQESM